MNRERNDVGFPRHQIEARLFEGQWKVKPARDLIVSCVGKSSVAAPGMSWRKSPSGSLTRRVFIRSSASKF